MSALSDKMLAGTSKQRRHPAVLVLEDGAAFHGASCGAAGEVFGEMGLISEEKRSATAVVEEDGTLLETIRAESLESLFKSNPVKIDMILSHLSHRLRRLTLDYVKACRKAVEEG